MNADSASAGCGPLEGVIFVRMAEDIRETAHAGMTVRVHEKIKDVSPKGEERERIQIFEGIILAIRGSGVSRTMTVRKVTEGFGVEKIYPMFSPVVNKVELVKTAHVRRAKLWFLSDKKYPFRRKLKEVMAK